MKTLKEIERKQQFTNDYFQKVTNLVTNQAVMFKALEDIESLTIRLSPNDGDINISASGDKALLQSIWKLLYRWGWKWDSLRPQENEPYLCGHFVHKDEKGEPSGAPSIWFSFSSTTCKKVKVGTKMVEQDIYEVRCEETSNG